MISAERLRALVPHLDPHQAFAHADALERARLAGDLTSYRRVRHFLAQVIAETEGLRSLAVNFDPAGMRKSNLDPGDWYRYRSRGYIRVRGQVAYARLARLTGYDLVRHPDKLELPAWAAMVAALQWRHLAANRFADSDDTHGVTLLINPDLDGLDDRIALVGKAREIWP